MKYKKKLMNAYKQLVRNGHFRYANNILYLMRSMTVLKLNYKTLYEYIISLADYNLLGIKK